MNEQEKQLAKELLAKMLSQAQTDQFKNEVRERIREENERFAADEAAQRTSRRQFLQTYNL
jgi:hypothetical protein